MPAAQPAPVDIIRTERRKHPRKDVIGSQLVSVEVKPQESNALMLDISQTGLAIQSLTDLESGSSRKQLFFRLPDQGTRVEVSAVVVWKNDYKTGFSFTEVDDSSRVALERWLQKLPDCPREANLEAGTGETPLDEGAAIPLQELVLTEEEFYSYVARARVLTCANGAAIAWADEQGMVCRANSGVAPSPGARVQLDQGLSAQCVRMGAMVRCDDTESDPRVDPDVCRRLNLRSVAIVPVIVGDQVRGLIEVFSAKPRAFSDTDMAGLETLARQCADPTHRHDPTQPDHTVLQGFGPAGQPGRNPSAKLRMVLPWVIGSAVLLAGAIQFGARRSAAPLVPASPAEIQQLSRDGLIAVQPADPTGSGSADTGASPPIRDGTKPSKSAPRTDPRTSQAPVAQQTDSKNNSAVQQSGSEPSPGDKPPSTASQNPAADAPPMTATDGPSSAGDSLPAPAVTLDGKSDEKLVSALNLPQPAIPAGPPRVSSGITPARLIRSVRPKYPPLARYNKEQGTVMLRMTIASNGRVRDVRVLSGQPDLARAAVDAVQEWRYEPYKLNGKPVDGDVNVTVNFTIAGQSPK